MSDPKSLDEYNALCQANTVITGTGLETTMHLPCMFCAASHFICYPIMKTQEYLANGATCKACGRGGKAILETREGSIGFTFVQTAGDDPPEWLPIKMRRLE